MFVCGHSVSAAIYETSANYIPILTSMVVTSFIFSLEIPSAMLLQFTIFSSIQKEHTNGLDILGGCLILVAVMTVPCIELLKDTYNKINNLEEDDKVTDQTTLIGN